MQNLTIKLSNAMLHNWHKQAADYLIDNIAHIKTPGLVNGKMGAAIFLFEYARISKNHQYADYANMLMDDIYELVISRIPISFENGLTGIGWGIAYLAKNGFIEADPDIILAEMDKHLFIAVLKSRTLIKNNELYGMGFYCLERLKATAPNLFKTNQKQLLGYIKDDCERLLTTDCSFIFKTQNLNVSQLNSILYFYIQLQEKHSFLLNTDKLLDYIKGQITKYERGNTIDFLTLLRLLEEMKIRMSGNVNRSKLEELKALAHEISNAGNLNVSCGYGEMVKVGWESLIYSL